MARAYTSQKTGLNVVSGKVKTISDDRTMMVVTTSRYNSESKQNEEYDVTVQTANQFGEGVKEGFSVTVAGYKGRGGTLNDVTVMTGQDVYEEEATSVITGFVSYAGFREEKNADGSPKTKQDGSPKKPHYDICIKVKDEDTNHYVNHRIKVYDFPNEEKSSIERMKKIFGKLDTEKNRIRVTIVTNPGQEYNYTSTGKDGREYTNYESVHMGYRFLDVEYVDQKEQSQSKDVPAKETAAETPVQEATPAQNHGNGFEQEEEMAFGN